ncbi:SpaH/EbpB family LPXTG-anchored major pilin [uncultured Microbacterium sp.]|uniref:SpaH/EbpB family LPXTG-anchored major pilin n=1 Tax=uncultured Microbacterium sp. TaxID=191216 RepID=UPI00262DCE19|nr:SpaH/EbpB family LPXTG-anchored major pilin [uncultured Microbacterium sp.]
MIRSPFQPATERKQRRRGGRLISATLASVVLASLSVLAGTGTSQAVSSTAVIDPDAVTAIEIHNYSDGSAPIAGAEFTATLVPGIDLLTNAGQRTAGSLTVGEAATQTSAESAAARATTDSAGDALLAPLAVGVYLVEEVITPVGFVPSEPFIVALPLTDPDSRDTVLTTVRVYPKNAHLSASLDVDDRDAVVLGDVITWTSLTSIPSSTRMDAYRVVQEIDSRLALVDAKIPATVTLDCSVGWTRATCPTLVEGRHFTQTYDPQSRRLTVDFTAEGLALLRETVAQNPYAEVSIAYRTVAVSDGEIVNRVLLYPSASAASGAPGAPAPVTDTAYTKWGPLAVIVRERDDPSHLIAGATFRVYGSADDARTGSNPIVVDGVSQWTTDSAGYAMVPGLRFSGFANGFDRPAGDPLYRYYYVVPTAFPVGYTGNTDPVRTAVVSSTEATPIVVPVWRADESSTGGGSLPVTGGQFAWSALIASFGLIGTGLFFIARRRRERDGATPRSRS